MGGFPVEWGEEGADVDVGGGDTEVEEVVAHDFREDLAAVMVS